MKNSLWFKSGLPLVIVLIAIVAAGVMISARTPPPQKPVETKPMLVDAKAVHSEQVQFIVRSQGNVLPKNQTNVSAQVSGQVVSLADNFVVGGMLQQGDVLATLEQDDFFTELKLAEAELAQARAAMEEESARAKVAEQEWRSVNSVVPPELGLRKPQLATAQANVKAAEAKLERAQRNLDRTEIRAPYNGLVVTRDINIGQFVSAGSKIATLYSTDVAEVRLPINDGDLAFINLSRQIEGQKNVTLTASVAGRPRSWEGQLVRTEGILDAGNRVIYGIVEVRDPYQRDNPESDNVVPLRYGQFVEASITGTESQPLFVIPRNVLRLDNTVLTVNEQREIEIKPVEVVRSDANRVFITSGLEEGSLIVTSAIPNPYEGMKIRLPEDPTDVKANPENDKAADPDSIMTDEAQEL